MVAGLLGNESSDSNRFTLVTPKSESDVRLQATLGNQNPTGLPVGVVRVRHVTYAYIYDKRKTYKYICFYRNKLLTNDNIRLLYKHTYETER